MVEGPVFDSHCHLFLMEGDPGQEVERARRAGVEGLICVGIDPESSRRSRDLADSLSGVFATAGIHPHTAEALDAAAGTAVEELVGDPRVVAVGETGLDYYRRLSPPEAQQRAFRTHCALSRETGKPLVVHTREAWPDVLRILEEERADQVILHCFSADTSVAREASARGYYCSFAGNITYSQNVDLRQAAAEVSPDRLLVETDSPFLTPQALRGEDNAPTNVGLVVEALAEARAEEPEEVAARTTANARTAFALPA